MGARHTNLHYEHDQCKSLKANSVSSTNTSEADGRVLQERYRGKLPEIKYELKLIHLKKFQHPTWIFVKKSSGVITSLVTMREE